MMISIAWPNEQDFGPESLYVEMSSRVRWRVRH